MKVHEALAQAFDAEGVAAVFGLMGDGNMYWMADLERSHPSVKVHYVRHEGAGLGMADGYARACGGVGVATVTSGPGIAQLSTSLVVAARAQTPVVVFAGDRPAGGTHHQGYDQRRFVEASEAGFEPLNGTDDAFAAVRNAFHRARIEQRPIVLNAPMDIQEMEYDGVEEYLPSSSLTPPKQRIRPDERRLAEAAKLIKNAKRVVILAGRGAEASDARAAIDKLGDRIGALLGTTLLAKGYLAPHDFDLGIAGLYASGTTAEIFGQAEVVVAVGASLHEYTLAGGYLFGDAKFVHIDHLPQVTMGDGRLADCYIQGDAQIAISELEQLLAEQKYSSNGWRTPEVKAALKGAIDPVKFDIEPGLVDPREASLLIDELLPPEVGVVIGSGHYSSFPTMMMTRPRRPTVFQKAFGCVGQGLPIALGAAVAAKHPVVLVEGDTSIMMHPQEFDTAARYKIPLLAIVLNDECLGSEYHKLRAYNLDQELAHIPSPDIGAVGRAFGCRGLIATSIADLRGGLEEFAANPGPMVIDVRVARNVISIPYRRSHFGQVA